MSQQLWTEVDDYIEGQLIDEDEALAQATRAGAEAGLPPIALTPAHGKFLHLLARIHGARSILELGTLGGYSTIWLARGRPDDGRLISLELDPHHADVAAGCHVYHLAIVLGSPRSNRRNRCTWIDQVVVGLEEVEAGGLDNLDH